MCNITFLPAGIEVPETEIYNAGTWNDDGHGWAIAADVNVLQTGRYMDLGHALESFKVARKAFPDAPALFHSRLATHGTVSLENVHPFTVGKFAAVAHNGILPTKFQPSRTGPLSDMSDTAIMARYWLAGRAQVAGIWTRKERRRIGRIIGKGNKLCILSVSPYLPEPRAYLINGEQGTWDRSSGAWFSSDSYVCEWTPRKSSSWTSGGWLWGGDGYEWQPDSDSATKRDKCPRCHTSSQLDITAGVCLHCDFCIDCLFDLRDCMCYYPGDKAADAINRNNTDDGIEIQISEIGGQS